MKLDMNKKLALFITIVTIIVLTGITYTFFSASVSNTNNEKIQTSTDEIEVPIKDIYKYYYLKSNIKITGGNETLENPYTLE